MFESAPLDIALQYTSASCITLHGSSGCLPVCE